MIDGRRVVLGVAGGVAAYKSVYLARRLAEAGAVVRVVMTSAATRFVGPQSFAAVTGHHPVTDLFASETVSPHTELARWADLVIVA
ncbi:MAG TPA: flavoprotein, partial [Acidimicrobiia bacterium]|nr:flavoprotein [Acidimicrobiia bacterium]